MLQDGFNKMHLQSEGETWVNEGGIDWGMLSFGPHRTMLTVV
jgi:hypothetical protein